MASVVYHVERHRKSIDVVDVVNFERRAAAAQPVLTRTVFVRYVQRFAEEGRRTNHRRRKGFAGLLKSISSICHPSGSPRKMKCHLFKDLTLTLTLAETKAETISVDLYLGGISI